MGRTRSENGREEKGVQSSSRKSEGRRLLGRLRRRWEDDIKMAVGEAAWEGSNWKQLSKGGPVVS